MRLSLEKLSISPTTEVFFLYRWDPSFFERLHRWLLKKDRYLLVLEEEGFSQDPFLEKLLEKKEVQLHILSSSLENRKERLKSFFWEFLLLKKELFTASSFRKTDPFSFLQKNFEEFSLGVDMVASELNEIDLIYKNGYENFLKMDSFQKASDYKGIFTNVPAFLFGAGESLEKGLAYWEKWENKALFFAAGTAFEALRAFGKKPHFTASIDKEAPSSRFEGEVLEEIPLFFQLRSNPKVVEKPFSKKILTADHPFYPLQREMYHFLQVPENFDSGWNVGTFLLSQMLYMGCNPIFLVGLDFSFSKEGYYAHKKEKREGELIPFTTKKQKTRFTKKDFLLAAKWIEDIAEKNPERIYNTAEEGLPFKGVEELSFEKLVEKFSFYPSLEKEKIQEVVNALPMYCFSTKEKQEKLGFLHKSFENCLKQAKRLLAFIEKHFSSLLQKNRFPDFLLTKAWEKEIAYKAYLYPLWLNWKEPLLREKDRRVPFFLHFWLQKLIFIQEKAKGQIAILENLLKTF